MTAEWVASPGDVCRSIFPLDVDHVDRVDEKKLTDNAHAALNKLCADQGLTATVIRELWRGTYTDALELLSEPSTHSASTDAIEGAKAAQSAADSIGVRGDNLVWSVWTAVAL